MSNRFEAGYRTPRSVTQAEFDAIECNRCGRCCQRLFHPGSLGLAMHLGANWAVHVSGYSDEQLIAVGWTQERIVNERRWASWIGDLVPSGEVEISTSNRVYSCSRYQDGVGCTRYEERPDVCRDFPYGHPILSEPECSWYVNVVEE